MLGDVVFLTISIHAPREGCDSLLVCTRSACVPFQSTHPARGATAGGPEVRRSKHISIHAPREGCDQGVGVVLTKTAEFQSTHPARGATTRTSTAQANVRFQSTHPARGATAHKRDHARRILYFNPRTPRGVRLTLPTARAPQNTISIHAPREGCDQDIHPLLRDMYISIHAPREGCDVITKFRRSLERDFNPRTPRGVRREVLDNGVVVHGNSNPRTPRGVRPRRKGLHWITDRFQSTHPARGATAGSWPTTSPNANFNPRTPRGVRRHRRPGRP